MIGKSPSCIFLLSGGGGVLDNAKEKVCLLELTKTNQDAPRRRNLPPTRRPSHPRPARSQSPADTEQGKALLCCGVNRWVVTAEGASRCIFSCLSWVSEGMLGWQKGGLCGFFLSCLRMRADSRTVGWFLGTWSWLLIYFAVLSSWTHGAADGLDFGYGGLFVSAAVVEKGAAVVEKDAAVVEKGRIRWGDKHRGEYPKYA